VSDHHIEPSIELFRAFTNGIVVEALASLASPT